MFGLAYVISTNCIGSEVNEHMMSIIDMKGQWREKQQTKSY
jgi:hypothetical protein